MPKLSNVGRNVVVECREDVASCGTVDVWGHGLSAAVYMLCRCACCWRRVVSGMLWYSANDMHNRCTCTRRRAQCQPNSRPLILPPTGHDGGAARPLTWNNGIWREDGLWGEPASNSVARPRQVIALHRARRANITEFTRNGPSCNASHAHYVFEKCYLAILQEENSQFEWKFQTILIPRVSKFTY